MALNNDVIATMLAQSHTIAVVGLSDKPHRASHEVASYLQQHGYRIVPINPACAGTTILGEPCYPSLIEAADALARKGQKLDIIDCFRRSDAIGPVVDEAILVSAPYVWMQLGVINDEAAGKARAAGIGVIMDRCIKIEHAHWLAATRDDASHKGTP